MSDRRPVWVTREDAQRLDEYLPGFYYAWDTAPDDSIEAVNDAVFDAADTVDEPCHWEAWGAVSLAACRALGYSDD